ncbi:MAG: hypothetical protein H0X33_03890 [Taibaiella sp.]|nr:hypothetical protein [Taibaiella sp.]
MKLPFSIALFLLLPICSHGKGINKLLKAELDSIGFKDQVYRQLANDLTDPKIDSLSQTVHIRPENVREYLETQQILLDKSNLVRIEQIIKRYGYPGKSLVGSSAGTVAYYVIQHSDKIPIYFPLIKKAAQRKELPYELAAMMEDRLLTVQGKQQLYGTQLWGHPVKDSVTGYPRPEMFFYPIKDIKNLGRRRKEAGFTQTIEEYAKEMGIPYRIKTPDFTPSDIVR